MSSLIQFFIFLQIVLFFFMTFHDWVHLPPLTDIRALEKHSTVCGRIINSALFALLILVPLALTWCYALKFPLWVLITLVTIYGTLTLGTIFSWWLPYFFGNWKFHDEHFEEYKSTHHFLPARGDNVIPNTFHVILHLQIWTRLIISKYLLFMAW